jgi:hypothetical protein
VPKKNKDVGKIIKWKYYCSECSTNGVDVGHVTRVIKYEDGVAYYIKSLVRNKVYVVKDLDVLWIEGKE